MNTLLFLHESNTPGWMFIAGTICVVIFLILLPVWINHAISKAEARITQWARENGWRLVEFKWEKSTGPFGGRHYRQVAYYQFVVCDQQGQKRTGWARFDKRLFSQSEFDIKWVDQQ